MVRISTRIQRAGDSLGLACNSAFDLSQTAAFGSKGWSGQQAFDSRINGDVVVGASSSHAGTVAGRASSFLSSPFLGKRAASMGVSDGSHRQTALSRRPAG